jgi:hypothetical protein
MQERGKPTVVIMRAQQSGKREAYESKAGDARRQGRVLSPNVGGGVSIMFVETSASIEAKLGVVIVGAITHDVASGDYFWSVNLAEMSRVPQRARTIDKAKDAVAHKIREWCEAASLISARRGRR